LRDGLPRGLLLLGASAFGLDPALAARGRVVLVDVGRLPNAVGLRRGRARHGERTADDDHRQAGEPLSPEGRCRRGELVERRVGVDGLRSDGWPPYRRRTSSVTAHRMML